jgi:beta-phosphoglucomutase
MTTGLKGLIFDLDGVIADSHQAHKKAWRALLSELDRTVNEEELDIVLEGRKRQEILTFFLGELTPAQKADYGTLKEKLFWESAETVRTVPGVLEFISDVQKRSLAIAVATSATRDRALAMLKEFNLSAAFAAVVTGDDVEKGKPDPTIFQRAAEQLQIAPQDLLVFEDAVAGVQAAKSAGMKCVAIAVNGRKALLERAGADLVVEDFTRIRLDQLEELLQTGRKAKTALI